MMGKFCLAMDNYFMLPKVVKHLKDIGVGIVGTSKFRNGWPPKSLRAVTNESASFNDFFIL